MTRNPYQDRARSIYMQACVAWAAGYVAESGHPLTHYIATALLNARARYPEARGWEFVALARRIRRLVEADYEIPAEAWSPLPDDPHAWVLDAEEGKS